MAGRVVEGVVDPAKCRGVSGSKTALLVRALTGPR